nr:PREDICTED: uncharacterized protein LOC100876438 isoform X1 [Megachile rotundata]XP_012145499.1 PREDICTED: uncharacterized protein LOC100876438 isoform X1 [Megachile rotundata]XP_012145500.1 PREDICTED: uncharacterized protein LOC100876438 isoform X1 [Megachile rotundata]
MASTDKEINNPHSDLGDCSSKTVNESILLQQDEQSNSNRNSRLSTLRKRSVININMKGSSKARNIEALHRLLCKPLSINVTRLSMLELQKISKVQHKIQNNEENRSQIGIRNRIKVKRKQAYGWKHIKKSAKPQSVSSCQTIVSNNSDLGSQDSVKSVKQPHIKLRRIDEVIHKIAQTFAKVIPNKECNARAHTDQTEKVHTIANRSKEVVSEPSDIDTDEHIQSNNSPISTSSPDINETLQLNDQFQNEIEDSDSTEINRNACNRNFKRKRKILFDSDDESDSNTNNVSGNSQEISSRSIKMLKLHTPDKKTENYVADKEHSDYEENTINTNSSIINVSYENLNVTENVSPKSHESSIRKRITRQQNNAATFVPSDVICAEERNELQILKYDSVAGAKEQTLSNKESQSQIKKSPISHESLKIKYNLLKNLRVYLIELDHIKHSRDNKYSALEIEQLTRKYMELLNNSEFESVKLSLVTEEMEDTQNDEILNTNASKLAKNIEIKQKKSSDNVAEEMSELDTSAHSEQSSTPLACKEFVLPSSPVKSSTRISKASRVTEHVIKTEKLKDRLHSSMMKSPNEKHSPNKESSETLIRKSSPKKSSKNMESLGSIQADTCEMIFSEKPVVTHNEKVLVSGRKTFVTKIHAKTVNIINPKVNTKKNITSCSSIISPVKKKPVEKKDNNSKSINYKCIVCDLRFENYSALQHHLTTHTQKQSNVLPNTSKESAAIQTDSSENIQEALLDSPEATESAESSRQTHNTKSSKQQSKGTSTQDLPSKKRSYFSKQRSKFMNMLCKPTACDICSKVFPTATDLAAHIFLHTEYELQKAYELAKHKKSNVNEGTKSKKPKQTKNTKEFDNESRTSLIVEKPAEVVSEQEKLTAAMDHNESLSTEDLKVTHSEKSTTATTTLTTIPIATASSTISTVTEPSLPVITAITAAATTTTITIATPTSVVNETGSEGLQSHSTESKSEKRKTKKSFKICECHGKLEPDNNCLQIEMVLLCHTCKVLFRSMECFDTHYDLPEYELCGKNRGNRSRTPNILCAVCGIIFNSVQEVRHHLENHARVRQSCTLDFRCKICKVVFIGIGAQFYVHWSKHLQDPYWKADESAFPIHSVVNVLDQNKETENYLQIAEYICSKCRIPFITESDLKRHHVKCKMSNSNTSGTSSNSNTNVEKSLEIEVNCSLCNDVFTEKTTFYKHVRNKHNFISEPQFVCVSLTLIKTAYICNICMEISESIDDFEDHWLKHSTAIVYFTCTYCSKAYCDGLNAFLEHARIHEVNVKQYVLSCTVKYENAEFVCKHCNVGFNSKKSFDEHDVIHKINILNSQNNKAQDHEISILESNINQISNMLEINRLSTEKQQKDAQKESRTNQASKHTNGSCSIESDKDKDREKLISILEGNEDDSEHELIIDWIEKPEEENKLPEEGRNKDKQTTLDNILTTHSIVQSSTVSKNSTANASTSHVIVHESPKSSTASENIVSTSSQTENPKVSTDVPVKPVIQDTIEIPKESQCLNVENADHDYAGNVTKDQKESTTLKKNSPPKPKQGFLRVKSLAELTNSTKPVPEHTENVNQRLPTHLIFIQKNKPNESSKQPGSLPFSAVPAKQITVATASIINDQQLKQAQMHINQNNHAAGFVQSSTSGYHKNLPACNIARTTTSIPRSATKSDNASTKSAAGCSNTQNQRAGYTAPTFMDSYITSLNNTMHSNPQVTRPSNANSKSNRYNNAGHQIPTRINNQNSKHYKHSPQIISFQYPYGISSSSNSTEPQQKSQEMVINPVTGEASTIFYTTPNNSTGGMSIVINQTTPAVQNMPTINILGQEQQQLYQPQVYSEPAMIADHSYAQSNATNFSATSNVYQIVTSEYQVPERETLPTYKVNLQSPIFICSYCPDVRSFLSAEQLEMHMNIDHNFICNTCGQRLYSFEKLNMHKMKHGFI